MIRSLALVVAVSAGLYGGSPLRAALRSEIIPETVARRHGLTRPWFTQIRMDPGRGRVAHVVLYDGILYIQTDRAMVHAVDAETGKTVWARILGRPEHPSMVPGLNRDFLAIVNGSRLYVCNRYNGELLYEVEVGGAPGAGAALSEKRAYVPMVSGMVMAYRLELPTDPAKELGKIEQELTGEETAAAEEERRENLRLSQEYVPPLSCQSFGRALIQPLVTREDENLESVAWPTDRGFLNIAVIDARQEDRLAIKYRLETQATIVTRPAYLPPDPKISGDSGVIYVTSEDGFAYAVREKDGKSLWRFSTGQPIIQPPVVIDEKAYIATQLGGMYCLDAKTGEQQWWAPKIAQFVAASKQRVYVADKIGRMLVLGADSGARLDVIPDADLPIKMINSQTDRLYLGTHAGLVQCLHELEQTEPVVHNAARKQAATGEPPEAEQRGIEDVQPPPQPGAGEEPPAAGQEPFGAGGDPFGGGDDAAGGDPFGGGDDAGGAAGGAADDPFGGDPFN